MVEPLSQLLTKVVGFSSEKMNESRPFLKSFADSSMEKSKEHLLPWLKTFLQFLSEKITVALPLVKSVADSSVEITKEKILPWLKHFVGFSAEKIKEHPVGFGLVVLIAVWYFCRKGGGGQVKTMKAPGRDYRMPRNTFEGNPRGYFRDLRGKQ